jgi:hypothetical protein
MIIEACNQCIKSKENWMVAMKIVFATRNHLHKSIIPENELHIKVVMDELEMKTKSLPDLSEYDHSIYNMESALRKQVVLFSRLIWRYDLTDLPCLKKIGHTGDDTLPWRSVSFVLLREELYERFASQPKLSLDHKTYQTEQKPSSLSVGSLGINRIMSSIPSPSSPFTPLTHAAFKFQN